MPRNDRPHTCPRCEEPPEAGDLFCGACGADLRPAMPPGPPPAAPAPADGSTAARTPAVRPGPENPAPRPPAHPPAPAPADGPAASPQEAAPAPTTGVRPATPAESRPAPEDAERDTAPETGNHAPTAPGRGPAPGPGGVASAAPRPGREPETEDHPTTSFQPPPAPESGHRPTTPLEARPAPEDAGPAPAPGAGGPLPGSREGAGPGRDSAPPATVTPADASANAPGEQPHTRDDPPAAPRPCVACGTGAVGSDDHCTHCGHKQPLARDHWERELRGVAAASDRGLRHRRNEDFFTVVSTTTSDGDPAGIAVVCDGVSSARRSDQASEAASEAAGASLRESIPRGVHAQQAMHDALMAAAAAVDVLATEEEREAQQNAPACTIVGGVVTAGILTVGWVGDSRAYWVPDDRGARPARLTEDDSWAAQMVAAGLLSEAQAYADARAHAITGWLGADAYELDPHTASFEPDRPGVVIVCTDGLWNYAETAEQMAAAVPADAAAHPLAAARHLVGFALDGGGHDNITVAVVPFTTPTEPQPGI